jgi:phosphoserine phosphatase
MDPKPLPEQFLNAFLERHTPSNGSARPLAVFDCDGTVIQGDIGESMFYRQIEHFAFRVSPAEILRDHPHRSELGKAYSALATTPENNRRTHPAFEPFAGFLLSWYFDQLAEGKIAKACTEIVQLFTGFAPAEVRDFAAKTLEEELQTPMGHSSLGGRTVARGARFLRESVDLLQTLQNHGFDILAISGSNKWSVEPVFAHLNVPAELVIGIDLVVKDNLLGSEARTPIPIQNGKVEALHRIDSRPPVLVASDSRNDIPLLLTSSDAKVYVNSHRRKTEDFFALGKIQRDHTWVVFDEPAVMLHKPTQRDS